MSEARRYEVPDLFTIDPQRLADLDGADLEQLNRAGFLRLAMLAAASTGNVSRLIDLKTRPGRSGLTWARR